jgi:hypothetical protein
MGSRFKFTTKDLFDRLSVKERRHVFEVNLMFQRALSIEKWVNFQNRNPLKTLSVSILDDDGLFFLPAIPPVQFVR